MKESENSVRDYLAAIGRRGGRKSRRSLTAEQAREMVQIREAKRAFRRFHAQCFWYMAPDIDLTSADLPEIARGLRTYGGREGYRLAAKICP
jgi:hypothetical protein